MYDPEADTLPEGVTEEFVREMATTVHESGHAVVAWHLGMAVESISVVPGRDTDGRVLWGHHPGNPEPTDHDRILIAMGGMLAALKAGIGIKRGVAGCTTDMDKVRALGRDPYDLALWEEVLDILGVNWPVVEDLAVALHQRREIHRPLPHHYVRELTLPAAEVAA